MFTPELPQWHVELLAGAYSLAANLDQRSDAATLLGAIAAVRPGSREIAMAQAMALFRQADFSGARALLEQADRSSAGGALVKALLAWSLFMQHDAGWSTYFDEAAAFPPEPTVTKLLEALARAEGKEIPSSAPREDRFASHSSSTVGLSC